MQESLGNKYLWHTVDADKVASLLKTNTQKGLSCEEAKQRLQEYGENSFSVQKRQGPVVKFLLQFRQPIVLILVVAGTLTVLLQEWTDSYVIFGVVMVNAIVGFVQEYKANRAMEALSRMVASENLVIREGNKSRVA